MCMCMAVKERDFASLLTKVTFLKNISLCFFEIFKRNQEIN